MKVAIVSFVSGWIKGEEIPGDGGKPWSLRCQAVSESCGRVLK